MITTVRGSLDLTFTPEAGQQLRAVAGRPTRYFLKQVLKDNLVAPSPDLQRQMSAGGELAVNAGGYVVTVRVRETPTGQQRFEVTGVAVA
jgi:hypothetical protein